MHANCSEIESLASVSVSEAEAILQSLSESEAYALLYDWQVNARANQLVPGTAGAPSLRNDWVFWLILAGRGFGKTRTGAETVRAWAEVPTERILMIAPTSADVRDVMIEGPSGLLQCYPPDRRPIYHSSKKLIEFPSGAIGILRSADEPERLRGPQFTKFWADEICAWRFLDEAWAQLLFGFRMVTKRLQGVITTTPKPLKVLKEILASADTVVTRGSSYENRSNLSDIYYRKVIAPYEGTRLGRQEINAEVLEDVPGALWTRGIIDATRINESEVRWDKLIRIVIGVDPAVSHNADSDETGIIVVALTAGQHVLVLNDLSCRESSAGWAKVVVAAYKRWRANLVVGEVNNGGDLVERNVRVEDSNIAFRAVRASRGKYIRAEPVSMLYEKGRVHHVGIFGELEDQLCISGGTRILTARGSIPVENVRLMDYVWTRAGWRRVLRTACNGWRKTIEITVIDESGKRHIVSVTPDHKIFVNGIFINSIEVQKNDRMAVCHSRLSVRLSRSMGSGIFGTSAMDISRQAGRAGGACFTGMSGNRSTDQSLKVGIFTTSMRTVETIPLRTFMDCRQKITSASMTLAGSGNSIMRRGQRIRLKHGPIDSRRRYGAHFAETNSNQQECVPLIANGIIEAVRESKDTRLVYDLTVDGCPEMFANGVLIHNCGWTPQGNEPSPDRLDALVWAITELSVDPEPTEGTIALGGDGGLGYSISPI